jgi:hypothetical protein
MNKVLLTGRLTRDPELRVLASGKNVTTFSVAAHRATRVTSRRTPLGSGGSGAADSPTHAGGSDARPIPRPPKTAPSHWRDRPARWRLGQPTAPKDLSWTLPRATRARNPKRRQRHAQSARHRILRRLTAKLRLVAPLWAPSRAK